MGRCIGPLLLLIGVLVAYSPALRGDFLWDDSTWLTDADAVPLLKDAGGVGRMWTEIGALQHYFPITGTSFWIDHHLWDAWTLPYHLENVLLHAFAALLFWRVLQRLEVPGAALAAAFFLLHPMMVESVAWITERKNGLSMVLFLAALLNWLRFEPCSSDGRRAWGAYAWAMSLFAAALLAKTSVIVMPVVLLLIPWWKLGRLSLRIDVLPTVPFFLIALAAGGMTMWLEAHRVGAQGPEWDWPWASRILIAGRAVAFYTGKLLWPTDTCAQYAKWSVEPGAAWPWLFPIAVGIMIALLWRFRARIGRGPLVGSVYFIAALFPVLGFFNVYGMSQSYVADRWVYVPSLGLFALAGAVVAQASAWLGRSWLAPLVALVVLPVLGQLTWRSAARFKNEIALWQATVDANPDSWVAHYSLGVELAKRGQLDEALARYATASEIRPEGAEIWGNQGALLLRMGKAEAAMAPLRRAIELNPALSIAYNSLGVALYQTGAPAQALDYYRRALQLRPGYAEAQSNLGNALQQTGKVPEAIAAYQQALKLDPNLPEVHCNLAVAYFQSQRTNEAIEELKQALRLLPSYSDALSNLTVILKRTGREAELPAIIESLSKTHTHH